MAVSALSPWLARDYKPPPGQSNHGTPMKPPPCATCDQTVLEAGEAVIIETPTAGGYGDPEERF